MAVVVDMVEGALFLCIRELLLLEVVQCSSRLDPPFYLPFHLDRVPDLLSPCQVEAGAASLAYHVGVVVLCRLGVYYSSHRCRYCELRLALPLMLRLEVHVLVGVNLPLVVTRPCRVSSEVMSRVASSTCRVT